MNYASQVTENPTAMTDPRDRQMVHKGASTTFIPFPRFLSFIRRSLSHSIHLCASMASNVADLEHQLLALTKRRVEIDMQWIATSEKLLAAKNDASNTEKQGKKRSRVKSRI